LELVKTIGEIIPLTKASYSLEEYWEMLEGYFEVSNLFNWRFLIVNEDGRSNVTGKDLPVNKYISSRLEALRIREKQSAIPIDFTRELVSIVGNVIIATAEELKHYFD
jgi:hypothetical protein